MNKDNQIKKAIHSINKDAKKAKQVETNKRSSVNGPLIKASRRRALLANRHSRVKRKGNTTEKLIRRFIIASSPKHLSSTLIIHPKNKVTEPLKALYKGKGYDIVSNYSILENHPGLILEPYKRIIIIGLGNKGGFEIDENKVKPALIFDQGDLERNLKGKQIIALWPYSSWSIDEPDSIVADDLIFDIRRSHTGLKQIDNKSEEEMKKALRTFAMKLREHVDKSAKEIIRCIGKMKSDDQVIKHNLKALRIPKSEQKDELNGTELLGKNY